MSAGEMRRAGEISETDSAEGVKKKKKKTDGALGGYLTLTRHRQTG